MKRVFLISSVLFFVGCVYKDNMATSVVDLAGNMKVVGWKEEKKVKNNKKIFSTSKRQYPLDSDADGVLDYIDRCPNTPLGVRVNHYGCRLITTLRLNFDFKSTRVKKEYLKKLERLANFLKQNKNIKIEIDGYTDNLGSKEYNLNLSRKRAEAVRDILVKRFHINPSRIVVKGFGEAYPIAPNTTETNRALNRRVEIVAIGNDSKFLNTDLGRIIN